MEQLEIIQEESISLDDIVLQCIRLLLNVLYTRIDNADSEEDFAKDLGEIRIITDPLGGIGEKVAQMTNPGDHYAVYFVCVPDEETAYDLELLFTNLAVSPRTLRETLCLLEQDYKKSTHAGGLEEAIDMITEVLYKATVIPQNSPISRELHKNASHSC